VENSGWQSADIAERYRRVAEIVIPGRAEILSLIARAATAFSPKQARILDLGAGYGDVTAAVLEHRQDSFVTLLDYNNGMLEMSRERFRDNPRVTILHHDLHTSFPGTIAPGSCDAVVSCFSIHHVAFENRVKLYGDILTSLKPGGLFINGDRFTGESAKLSEWEFDNWIGWMVDSVREKTGSEREFEDIKVKQLESDKRLGDKPDTIWEGYARGGFRIRRLSLDVPESRRSRRGKTFLTLRYLVSGLTSTKISLTKQRAVSIIKKNPHDFVFEFPIC
jgi:SAM-dependent methyltransferase